MTIFNRILNLPSLIKKKSFFLFGPRATGKTLLIESQLGDKALIIDLLRSDVYRRLSANPSEIEEIIASDSKSLVVIDEIQKIPELLDEVHRLIEKKNITFLLTGSSARKLKSGGHNLLAGRAWEANLFPLTYCEIKQFSLDRYLKYGGLPSVYLSEYPRDELVAYSNTYLKEEIQAESLVRKIPAFTKFLSLAAKTSGNLINYAKLASDSGIPASTIREYYHILEDTLVGFILPVWQNAKSRKAAATDKFYLFDIGVRNSLALESPDHIDLQSELAGNLFEQFIILEIRAYLSYRRISQKLSFFRSRTGTHEVDLLIGDAIAIEIKYTSKTNNIDLKNLKYIRGEAKFKSLYLISNDKVNRYSDGINIIHWRDFLTQLWSDKIATDAGFEFEKSAKLADLSSLERRASNLDFKNASLKGVNFEGADLEGANFEGADLEGANFKGANLKNVNFNGANLRNAEF